MIELIGIIVLLSLIDERIVYFMKSRVILLEEDLFLLVCFVLIL
jgi:hypothetical protein